MSPSICLELNNTSTNKVCLFPRARRKASGARHDYITNIPVVSVRPQRRLRRVLRNPGSAAPPAAQHSGKGRAGGNLHLVWPSPAKTTASLGQISERPGNRRRQSRANRSGRAGDNDEELIKSPACGPGFFQSCSQQRCLVNCALGRFACAGPLGD